MNEILKSMQANMEKTADAIGQEMTALRTGRASIGLLENVKVDYYGSLLPINQTATISIPEPQLIIIQPWDKASVEGIMKGIQKANIGLSPQNDGNLIRIPIPPLNEERRNELVKVAHRIVEEGRVSIRNSRHEAREKIKAREKNDELSKDESFDLQEEVQTTTDRFIKKIDEILAKKETEIHEV